MASIFGPGPSGAFSVLARSTLLVACLMLACGRAAAQDRAFDFALIGDMPYTKVQEREYQRVLAALNVADLAFVAHIGDFQFDSRPYNRNPASASMPCVDDNYKAILSSFQSIRHPFILTPGDDSIITAVGMTPHVPIMVIAIVVAVVVMLIAATPLANFITANPTIVMLALGFLLMIGMVLIAEGFGAHVPKGYIYAA